ncbi:hypothetical protein TTHERM_00318790 (macronuclear) [Tetrahymena thermophila SB210]|uniref:Uncharacterized protein n=1 Tax=Tetrahymena thermophila (strain SB210) TaxID=312017 RepID=I7ML58_TETTS|nr:hypothetical protein TTHERM_00318790 [Tetrahymena thermophila SB210]EAS01216.2 hypothetical protein TTHERM_00318790 [Tetrahymena thermophila SB210]|eukprot:XP_001021461.2 hypothetical protein TTHERM_00318790 [Tetrahymena thermophila SB210]
MANKNSLIFDSMMEEKMNHHSGQKSNLHSQFDLNYSQIDQKNSHYININQSNPVQLDKKQKHVQKEYYNYLENTGIKPAFEIVFNEIVGNNIKEDQVFQYAANRLREIGQKLKEVEQL